ncbi:hypothetical protein V6N13_080042 [Hibiscus sabdariffa]
MQPKVQRFGQIHHEIPATINRSPPADAETCQLAQIGAKPSASLPISSYFVSIITKLNFHHRSASLHRSDLFFSQAT